MPTITLLVNTREYHQLTNQKIDWNSTERLTLESWYANFKNKRLLTDVNNYRQLTRRVPSRFGGMRDLAFFRRDIWDLS